MLWEEREAARGYNRWMTRRDLMAAGMRWNMGPVGVFLVNTPVLSLARTLNIRPHHRLLDIGCGPGSLLRHLARQIPFETPPVGLDVSAAMLRLGRRQSEASAPVALLGASASSIPFADESFDLVLASHMWKHLSDRALLHNLLEVKRVLRPGGSYVAWEFSPRSSRLLDGWNRRVLTIGGVRPICLRNFHVVASAASDANFSQINRIDLGPFIWPPIPRLAVRLYK